VIDFAFERSEVRGHDHLLLETPGHATVRRRNEEAHVIWNIIVLIVVGLIAGFIARAVIPGKQDIGIGLTIALGIVGSLVGNLLGSLFTGDGFELGTAGIIGSIIGAIIVLGIYVAVAGRKHVSR
jgi:uncharacterized membrane protein YeaQ/YmgE (transglycosylase-associated protein family)